MDASSLQTQLLYQSVPAWQDLHLGQSRRVSQQTLSEMKLLPVQAAWNKRLLISRCSSAKAQRGAEPPLPLSGDKSLPTEG